MISTKTHGKYSIRVSPNDALPHHTRKLGCWALIQEEKLDPSSRAGHGLLADMS
jgi:hypothetical protein